jgi:type II secretory pathway pseudopilin PulG
VAVCNRRGTALPEVHLMNWMQSVVARKQRAEEGMTLIELLVVILNLGILAAIVVVGIGAFQDTGDKEACKTTVGEVESATAAYIRQEPGVAGRRQCARWRDQLPQDGPEGLVGDLDKRRQRHDELLSVAARIATLSHLLAGPSRYGWAW